MTAAAERALLARADELADTADLAGWLTEIIGWARAARVDQAALAGRVTAVRILGGDVTALFRAVRGRHAGGRFGRDTELLDILADADAGIDDRARAAAQLRRQASQALQRARADEDAARDQLACALAMPVADPCRGCHSAKAAAIAAAERDLDNARERASLASDTLEILAGLKLAEALQAVPACPRTCARSTSRPTPGHPGPPGDAQRRRLHHRPGIPGRHGRPDARRPHPAPSSGRPGVLMTSAVHPRTRRARSAPPRRRARRCCVSASRHAGERRRPECIRAGR